MAPGDVSHDQQWLPHVGRAVDDAVGHDGNVTREAVVMAHGPRAQAPAQGHAFGLGQATPEGLNLLRPGPAAHPQDNGPVRDRVRQVAYPGQGHGCKDREMLYRDVASLAYAPRHFGAAPVASVEQRAEVFVVARLRPIDRVHLVEQDSSLAGRDRAEQRGR